MSYKLNCEIVKDLIPSYIEHMTSEISNDAIEEHLSYCDECSQYLAEMQSNLEVENQVDVGEVKNYFGKAKLMYILRGILIAIATASIVIPFIVNLAVSHTLSWFYIVLGGCIMFFTSVGIILYKKKNKFISILGVVSILVVPYLYVIEAVLNKYMLKTSLFWVKTYGLPISLIWIGIIWISIGANKLIKLNMCFSLSIFFILSAFGSWATNALVQDIGNSIDQQNVINSITLGMFSVIFFIIGIIRDTSLKNRK